MKRYAMTFFLLFAAGCAHQKNKTFSDRLPNSDSESKSFLIPFPSGAINPSTFESSIEERASYLKAALESGKSKGILSKSDCFTEDVSGYYTICFIAQAEKVLKKLQSSHPYKKLFAEEYAALAWFADFGFQGYNEALWSQNPTLLTESEAGIKLALSGLNRLPSEVRNVVRCDISESGDRENFQARIHKAADRYVVGESILIKAFWSTSKGTDPDYISQWIEPCHVELKISLKGAGADISKLSSRPHEQEILVRPMTQFKVLKKTPSTKNGLPYFFIELEQM